MYKVLNTLIAFRHKDIKITIKPIDLLKTISNTLKKYKPYYNLNLKVNFNKNPIIINSDEKLITILIDLLYVEMFNISKEMKITVLERENFVFVKFESDKKIDDKIKITDFFNQLKNNIKSNVTMYMYLVNKIINYFNYDIKIEEKSIIVKFSILPPVKFMKNK